jgi:hypothetical protein
MPQTDLVLQALTSRPRAVKWYYNKGGRNWVLAPERVLDEQLSRALSTDTATIGELAQDDQELSRSALEEFYGIIADLRILVDK